MAAKEISSASLYTIKIRSQEEVEFNCANLKIELYGADGRVADNAATLISETVLGLRRMPATVDLEWPVNDYQMINNPPVKHKDDAVYYLVLSIDTNKDGKICKGDYILDYDGTPFFTIDEKPSETLVFDLQPVTGETCQKF
jgi:hypothetical protein